MTETLIQGYLGQLNSMEDAVETELNEEEYHDFCDAAATLGAYLKLIRKRQTSPDEDI